MHPSSLFSDYPRGFGVHEVGEGIDFYWIHANKIKQDFGYVAIVLYWKGILRKCHPSNHEEIMKKIKKAESENGETLFDIIVDQLLNKNDCYDHTLSFDKEY